DSSAPFLSFPSRSLGFGAATAVEKEFERGDPRRLGWGREENRLEEGSGARLSLQWRSIWRADSVGKGDGWFGDSSTLALDGMDPLSSYNLEIRIIANNTCFKSWYRHSQVVDADMTNFKDLIDDILNTFPCGYGNVVKLLYYCHYSSEPPAVPLWEEVDLPCTPSASAPPQIQSTLTETETQAQPKDLFLMNTEPQNEHAGVDEEGEMNQGGPDSEEQVDLSDSEGGTDSDSDYADDEADGPVHDKPPEFEPEIVYDKDDPPMIMILGSKYPNMSAFRLALASHAVKNEFEFNIEKSDIGRYRAYCSKRSDGCNWRIHASTMGDNITVKVIVIKNWIWFMERLKDAIGTPPGLTFCTDYGAAVMEGVSKVFPDAEHRESKPQAMKFLQDNHKKLWTRSQFSTLSKVDYVTNNLSESCNHWVKPEKGRHLDDLLDAIRAWQVSGIPCKHALAFITSIRGEKIEDHVDDYFSVEKFKAAYEGTIPALLDKSMWPKSDHGFFMHPPLLKSTAGRRRNNRFKGALEGGTSVKGRHQCPICKKYGHHWYTCKDGDPSDIAAMLADRGPPKKRLKKAVAQASTETSIVPVGPTRMVFLDIPGCAQAKSSGKRSSASTGSSVRRPATGSNDVYPMPISMLWPEEEMPVGEEPSAEEVPREDLHAQDVPGEKASKTKAK
ncbi:hypothetical protein U9M48_022760, partial [Paspalum notatum var. saurae]